MRAALVAVLFLSLLPAVAHAQEARHGTAGDWAVDVWVGGVNGSFDFQFTRDGQVLQLSWEPTFQHGEQNLAAPLLEERTRLGFDAWIRAELAAYLESAVSFRDRALRRLEQLRHGVEQDVRSDALGVRVRPPDGGSCLEFRATDQGEGAFDVCPSRRLTPPEKAELLAAMRSEIGRRERLVRQNYRAWYATVLALARP